MPNNNQDNIPEQQKKFDNWILETRKNNWNQKKIVNVPKPILKWAGGKRQLIEQISQHLPKEFNNYFEPFFGGGALFFYLMPNNATIIDNNPVLTNVYQIIRDSVEDLIKSLKKHRNEKEYFYDIRKMDREEGFTSLSLIEQASRTIFLNKTCYNGLYRVNSKGQFNVPFGKYKNPTYCDEKNLRSVSRLLQNVTIMQDSFTKVLDFAQPKDLIYFDPPYVPLSKTANFTGYTKESFSLTDQEKLAEIYEILDKRGCFVLQSNSHSDFILERYKNYDVVPVDAKRAINSDATKRGIIKEVLIKNY